MDEFLKEEIKLISTRAKFDELMSKHTTFRIGGGADCYIEVQDETELSKIIRWSTANDINYLVVGAGSNLLVADKGIRDLVIKLVGEFNSVTFENTTAKVGAGAPIGLLLLRCIQNNAGGAEFLAGIPGTIGGAVIMNAGTKNGEIGNIIDQVTVMDSNGNVKVLGKNELKFSYRKSSFDKTEIILSCKLTLHRKPQTEVEKEINNQINLRMETQPWNSFQAGSIFKNPVNNSAGELIEQIGMKGYRIGNACVSPKHANFIINLDKATANDVYSLIQEIIKKVKETSNIELEPEIRMVGEW